MSLIVKVTSATPRAPLGQLLRVPLGLDVWEVKPDHLILRAGEAQVERLQRMGYAIEQLHQATDYLAAFAVADATVGYHSAETLEQDLRRLATSRPEIAELREIGRSVENRPIWALRLGERRGAARKVLFMGCHHAREWIAVEVPYLLADHLVQHADQSPVKEWLGQGEIWIAPMVNPDGHEHTRTADRLWRKNRRRNPDGSFGVDPNRNYGYMWGTLNVPTSSHVPSDDTYVGPRAFSEPETRAVRDLLGRELFGGAITYHSYSQLILYPWGYTAEPIVDPDDRNQMSQLAGQMQQLIRDVHGKVYTPQQSSQLYPTAGDTTDWTYGVYGIPSFTIELRPRTQAEGGFILPANQIQATWEENRPAALEFIRRALEETLDATPGSAVVGSGHGPSQDVSAVSLHLVRHGEPEGFNGDTPLSAEGKRQVELLAILFKAAQPAVDKVVTSPALRARQTAEIICQRLGLAAPETIDALGGAFVSSEQSPQSFRQIIQRVVQGGSRHVVVAGHFPYLSAAVAWLIGSQNVSLPQDYGAAARFLCGEAIAGAAGRLQWLVTPALLRAVVPQ